MTRASRHDPARQIASLKMVAAHVGLSAAAVSRVLARAPAAASIPTATQDRIFAAADELNYRPNHLARSLRRGQSHTLGVLLPEIGEVDATLVLAGLEQGLLEAGYFYILLSHHHRAELIEQGQSMMMERAVDGFVALATALPGRLQIPTVTIACPEQDDGTAIVLDHRRAAELAVDHLAGLGHRRIAFIRGQSTSSGAEVRWRAIQDAVHRAGLKLDPVLAVVLEGDAPGHEPGYAAVQRLLVSKPRFTAIFACSDVSAIGAIRALREAGLSVPADISVVGFDDLPCAALHHPALTTIRQPLRSMGLLAAKAIVRQIAAPAETVNSRRLIVAPELIVRESTGRSAKPRR